MIFSTKTCSLFSRIDSFRLPGNLLIFLLKLRLDEICLTEIIIIIIDANYIPRIGHSENLGLVWLACPEFAIGKLSVCYCEKC